MRAQLFIVGGALFGLSNLVSGVPALKFPDYEEYCGVTTIYVTVAPTSSTTTAYQPLETPPSANYGGVFSPVQESSADSDVSVSDSSSNIGVDSTSTAVLTTTVHQTIVLTNTMTGSWHTRTQTVPVTSSTLSSALLLPSTSSSGGEASTQYGSILISTSSSATAAQSSTSAVGSYVLPPFTAKTRSECSDDLVICPETSASGAPSGTSVQSVASTQLTSPTSSPSTVYVIETLTVIPVESIPSASSSVVTSTGSAAQSTFVYAIPVIVMESTASTPVTASIVSTLTLPTSTLTSYSQGHTGKVSGSWNTSTESIPVTSDTAAIGSAPSTTLTVDALSTESSSASIVSSESINFSNSYLFYNETSSMAAAAGFTSFSTSLPLPSSSTSSGSSSSSGSPSFSTTSPSLAQTTDLAQTESCSETVSTTSAVDALQTISIPLNASSRITGFSSTSPSAPTIASEDIWTPSCSEDSSAVSTANAEQYYPTSVTGGVKLNYTLTTSTLSRKPCNSTTPSFSTSSNVYVASSSITASATSTNQSAASVYASTAISSFSSASTKLLSTATTTLATTSSLTTSLLSTNFSSTSSSGTSEVSPINVTSSSISSKLPFYTSQTVSATTSPLSLATYSQLPSVTSGALSTSVLTTSTTSSSPAEDTCTDSTVPPSLSATSPSTTSTLNSSILTFSTLTTSTAPYVSGSTTLVGSATTLSTSSVSISSSSPPQPSACGEQVAFTLNFDDIPPLAVKDNSTADPMPLFSPYRQFYFSDGWTIVPPPTDPYRPSSGQLLVEFLADPDSPLGYTGAVGNGKNTQLGCFNFNAIGMSVGCDSKGPDCDWQFTGLRYNNVTQATDTITSQLISTAACAALANCTLVPIVLDGTFQNLTELRINVTVSGVEKIWWLDDLNLSWFDDSCDASLCRGGHS